MGCYDEDKYLNEGRPLNGKPSRGNHSQKGSAQNISQGRSNNANANIRDAVAAARAELRNQKDQGAGFFKDKKKRVSTLISTTTTIIARTATTAGIRTNAAVVEIKVVEIKEEMKVEAEEDKC